MSVAVSSLLGLWAAGLVGSRLQRLHPRTRPFPFWRFVFLDLAHKALDTWSQKWRYMTNNLPLLPVDINARQGNACMAYVSAHADTWRFFFP